MTFDAATLRQQEAADPRASTWVSANAGSGKTRVLTDRVARLLLDGVNPQNILCLTYTKAAASEMQNRLFRRLGGWSMMEDAALVGELRALGASDPQDGAQLREARRLFAKAVETPGGLRIQTIHSFCSALLRRFPLEAGVSPDFREMEERASELLRAEVLDELASGPEAARVTALAEEFGQDAIDGLLRAIAGRGTVLGGPFPEALVRRTLDLAPDLTLDGFLTGMVGAGDRALIGALRTACAAGSSNDVKAAEKLARLSDGPVPRLSDLGILESVFLYGSGARKAGPFSAKVGDFPTAATRKAHPELAEAIEPLMLRCQDGRATRQKFQALARTMVLYDFAQVFLPRLAQRKQEVGALDFDDLISRTLALVTDPLVAQWVLFRLDGGLDHILVDEAQDTSPIQWRVIQRLVEEFASGEGARAGVRRTLFVVGDKKQSIYSFQGADPEEFHRMQDYFRDLLAPTSPLSSTTLEFSFRSASEILELVDAAFPDGNRDGLGPAQPHRAFKTDLPGRVDLWPPVVGEKEEEQDKDWTLPVDTIRASDPKAVLARKIAAEIARMKDEETIPVSTASGIARRPVSEGDILILLRGRKSGLFHEIIRALKTAGLRVAGADRLRVGAELAVKDIVAVLRFLALPEDDLSLASALRSPLLGLSEADLFDLAEGRPKGLYLWQRLRAAKDRFAEALTILDDLRGAADYLRPFDLIARLLTRHGGRRRLVARLGTEAEDGIDALMAQALSYEQSDVPGLTGFLEWIATDTEEIKRQIDSRSDQIRVMTIHGAKGLEAPIVILPDTIRGTNTPREVLYPAEGHLLWASSKDDQPEQMLALREELIEADAREARRLLYVALTRAECWLIACVAGEPSEDRESWYASIAAGLETLGQVDHVFPTGQGKRVCRENWNDLPLLEIRDAGDQDVDPPALGEIPAPRNGVAASPSDLGGTKVLPGEQETGDKEQSLAAGTVMHALLEYLPAVPADKRAERGRRILDGMEETALAGDPGRILADALILIERPDLAELFAEGSRAEVPISAELPSIGRLSGVIDRLLIEPDRILAIDYKTNRLVPTNAAAVPEGLLRQMGAYHEMLSTVFPGRFVETAILWTATGDLMKLPQGIVTAALSRAGSP